MMSVAIRAIASLVVIGEITTTMLVIVTVGISVVKLSSAVVIVEVWTPSILVVTIPLIVIISKFVLK